MQKIDAEATRQLKVKLDRALTNAFEILENATPVWSARTLANYKFGVGLRPAEYSAFNDSVHWKEFFTREPEIDEAIAISKASLESARDKIRFSKEPFNQSVWIVNNVTYDNGQGIEALEFGVVGRQPYYMMSHAAAVARSAITARI
jgi:hypothetical protein